MLRLLIRGILALSIVSLLALVIVLIGKDPEPRLFKSGSLDSLETALVIRDPTLRRAFFGRLQSKDDIDYFTFTTKEPVDVFFELRTPTADASFNPMLMLYGPGLPKPNEDPSLPIGDQNGAIIARMGEKTRRAWFDVGLLTSFYEGPRIAVRLPRAGSYALAIRSSNGKTGRYVLKFGQHAEQSADAWAAFLGGTIQAVLRLY